MTRATIFDLETSGLIDKNAPVDASHQPKVVSISVGVYDDGQELAVFDSLIRPEGWSISDTVSALNGITQREAATRGVPLRVGIAVLSNFSKLTPICASYDFDGFDAPAVRCALATFRNGCEFPPPGVEAFDIRKAAKALCRLPGDDGSAYKSPDLATASLTLLGKTLTSKKPADKLRASADLFFAAKKAGM